MIKFCSFLHSKLHGIRFSLLSWISNSESAYWLSNKIDRNHNKTFTIINYMNESVNN